MTSFIHFYLVLASIHVREKFCVLYETSLKQGKNGQMRPVCFFLLKIISRQLIPSKKIDFGRKIFFQNFWPFPADPGVPLFSGLGALIKNRLGYSSNLAHWSLHAKFQPIRTIQLARAMGVVRFLAQHLVIGGHL